jgi:hypothetical protein
MANKPSRRLSLFGCLLLAWLPLAWADDSLTIIYSGNLDGELEPCGCSAEGNLGGIKRRATLLQQLRAKRPDLLVVSAGGLLSADGPGDRLKAEYIMKGFVMLNYDAIGVQWRDLAYGPDFAANGSLPWVLSNQDIDGGENKSTKTSASKNPFAPNRLIIRGKQRIRFFSWLDAEASPLRKMQGQHSIAEASPLAFRSALQQAKKDGELTLVASTLSSQQFAAQVGLDNVDVLIEGSAYEVFGKARREQDTLVVQPGSRGMRLGRLDVSLRAGHIEKWQHSVLPMPDSIADAPQLQAWYEEYNARVKADYLQRVATRKQQESGESPFVGEAVCQTCHQEQHKIWFDSRHAIAYEDLEDVNKAFDPACIKCHTVGFEQPGGFFDMSITGHLLGVQCESCHGAGRPHVEAAGNKPLPNSAWPREKICAQCHVQKHSPGFELKTYWPRIAH